MSERWIQQVFDEHSKPAGRSAESFTYKIEQVWDGHAVDTFYTDSRQEAHRVIGHCLSEAYEVRVTHEGKTESYGEVK